MIKGLMRSQDNDTAVISVESYEDKTWIDQTVEFVKNSLNQKL